MKATVPAMPARPPRDLRLDVVRGWMQLSIFVSHIAGTGLYWFIHASWGLSDSSEQFVFLSGLGLGSVFALKSVRDGFAGAVRDLGGRLRRLYAMHLGVVAVLAVLAAWADARLLPGEAARMGWGFLAAAPAEALAGLAVGLYQPDFTGILPLFAWCMLLLPGFLWLAGRFGAWALLPSAALYAGVQLGGLEVPGIGGTALSFNPLAWQFLFLLGAWFGRQKLLAGRALPAHPLVTAGAAAVVAVGFYARLVDHGALPYLGLGGELLEGKSDLPPTRLLHALALAWLVACILPREAGWMRGRLGMTLAAIGRNSLPVFCLGLVLSWVASTALRLHPQAAPWLDPLLILAGTGLLASFALWADRGGAARRTGPERAGGA
ncbi:OpgC domain-containing protein [Falsiroseomonas sp. HW251]|uniref:OpgC domain-containing protein n=1 Tax=Falsiroseomonas sp. HW251 TaxID=3390998 RepID=UPI003D321409